ncbi:hypothetical protein [Lactiplantibacillus daowaiensis]|uniref:Integral membrane protein n=2 Tax=Lactiplantibacillus daowaiensis TaxID=2559918 RepID=A0ABW1S1E5_9LACO
MKSLVQAKGLVGFVYGVLLIGMYSAYQQTKSAMVLVLTAEMLAWLLAVLARWQAHQATTAADKQVALKSLFMYLPVVVYTFFQNPLYAPHFNFGDCFALLFCVLVTLWGYQFMKARQ